MKPGSPQAKILFAKKETEFKSDVDKSKSLIKKLEGEIQKNADAYNDYRYIAIANEYLSMVLLYVKITDDMAVLRGVKNDTYLNEGRKSFYNALLALEKVFTDIVNLEPTEIQQKIEKIAKFDPARKIILYKKIRFVLDKLSDSFGSSSKYRFAFNDMFARYGIIIKNSSNIKALTAKDPRKPFYVENDILTNMLIDVLTKAADKMREKYETSTKEFEDMRKATKILEELKRIFVLLGDSQASDETKKKYDVWKDKLEKDLKAKDQKDQKDQKLKQKK